MNTSVWVLSGDARKTSEGVGRAAAIPARDECGKRQLEPDAKESQAKTDWRSRRRFKTQVLPALTNCLWHAANKLCKSLGRLIEHVVNRQRTPLARQADTMAIMTVRCLSQRGGNAYAAERHRLMRQLKSVQHSMEWVVLGDESEQAVLRSANIDLVNFRRLLACDDEHEGREDSRT